MIRDVHQTDGLTTTGEGFPVCIELRGSGMSKQGGSLSRCRRLRHEVPEVPPPDDLNTVERAAQDSGTPSTGSARSRTRTGGTACVRRSFSSWNTEGGTGTAHPVVSRSSFPRGSDGQAAAPPL
jgi:hypothetical protein